MFKVFIKRGGANPLAAMLRQKNVFLEPCSKSGAKHWKPQHCAETRFIGAQGRARQNTKHKVFFKGFYNSLMSVRP